MTIINQLSDKRCIPCQGGVPPLDNDSKKSFLGQLKTNWSINEFGHLFQNFEFDNFMLALDFANKIAIIAESEDHHPDLAISWGRCGVEIWTHKIDGLTESDFILAAKIERICKSSARNILK